MPTALFFPSYLGSGFGHVSRCLALADELKTHGWRTPFALAGVHAEKVRRAGQRVFELRYPFRPKMEADAGPAYTVFSDMNYQLVRDRFHSPRIVRACVREAQNLLKRVQPDVLVGDTWPLTYILGRLAGLPVVQIIKSVVHPAAPRLIWWQDPPAGLVSPDPRPVFNPVLRRYGLPEIRRAEDLLVGDLLLVPSIPELDPLPLGLPKTHYVGALTRLSPPKSLPSWLVELDSSRPLIYVTIGGGAGPVGSRWFFQIVSEALTPMDLQAIVSTSRKFPVSSLPTPPSNVVFRDWVPGPAVIARAAVVVFHGGYGTTMETVRHGVPSVVLPFHSEQEANGRRLEASGVARVLLPSREPFQVVPSRWKGGEFTTLVRLRSDLEPSMLREAIASVLTEDDYRQNACRLNRALDGYGGPSQAADLLENLVQNFPLS
jgi:UDP:flavonoid glycosyltransferase YjiC (YdhE family)